MGAGQHAVGDNLARDGDDVYHGPAAGDDGRHFGLAALGQMELGADNRFAGGGHPAVDQQHVIGGERKRAFGVLDGEQRRVLRGQAMLSEDDAGARARRVLDHIARFESCHRDRLARCENCVGVAPKARGLRPCGLRHGVARVSGGALSPAAADRLAVVGAATSLVATRVVPGILILVVARRDARTAGVCARFVAGRWTPGTRGARDRDGHLASLALVVRLVGPALQRMRGRGGAQHDEDQVCAHHNLVSLSARRVFCEFISLPGARARQSGR
eukprot:3687726-Prymnesium_polylepis.1